MGGEIRRGVVRIIFILARGRMEYMNYEDSDMRIDVYLHGDKESMLNAGEEVGICGQALELFKYACCEVKITLDVSPSTGEAEIIAVDGRELEQTKP